MQRRRPGSLLKLMSSTLAPRQPRPSSERIVETAEIEPATGTSPSAWEAGGSGLKPQALALDETRSRRTARQTLSLRQGKAGVYRASVGAVEIRPKRASRTRPRTLPLALETRSLRTSSTGVALVPRHRAAGRDDEAGPRDGFFARRPVLRRTAEGAASATVATAGAAGVLSSRKSRKLS